VSITGLDMSFLTGWYNSRINASVASNVSRAGLSYSGGAASAGEEVLPPWDVRTGQVQSLEDIRRKVLANGVFFQDPSREFSDIDAEDDHKALFSLHQGLKRLASLAEEAADKSTADTRRDFLQARFNNGLSQFDSYFDNLDLESVNLLKGEELSKMEGEVAISRGLSQFKTGTIHSGAYDAEVASLTGDVQFTIAVKKNGRSSVRLRHDAQVRGAGVR